MALGTPAAQLGVVFADGRRRWLMEAARFREAAQMWGGGGAGFAGGE